MYQCINELSIMTVQLIQFRPSLQLLQSFFQDIALKGYLTQRQMAITFSILQKNFLTKCGPYIISNQKMSNVHFDLLLKLSQS
jgi:poly(3-hydroxyalkanoate) synthetase